MAITDKLTKVLSTKSDIKIAIEEKEQVVGDIPFAEYADKIREIEGGGTEIEEGVVFTRRATFNNLAEADHYSKSGRVYPKTFYDQAYLSNVNFKNDIYSIDSEAFYRCFRLNIDKFPETLASIGNYAFLDCWELSITSIPANVTSIGRDAFTRCRGLTNLIVPDITRVEIGTFESCTGLKNITIGSEGNSIQSIASTAFRSVTQSDLVINIYVDDVTEELPGAPWGATNAQVNFLQA